MQCMYVTIRCDAIFLYCFRCCFRRVFVVRFNGSLSCCRRVCTLIVFRNYRTAAVLLPVRNTRYYSRSNCCFRNNNDTPRCVIGVIVSHEAKKGPRLYVTRVRPIYRAW
jgi:hypothetical protein